MSDKRENAGSVDSLPVERESGDGLPGRRQLIRDAAVFQVKLMADGFRDLLLVPLSIGAAIVALLKGGKKPGTEFYELLRYGKRTENWINLFGAASQTSDAANDDEFRGDDIDQLVARAESFVMDEYRHGGVTRQAKERLAKVLAAVRRRAM